MAVIMLASVGSRVGFITFLKSIANYLVGLWYSYSYSYVSSNHNSMPHACKQVARKCVVILVI